MVTRCLAMCWTLVELLGKEENVREGVQKSDKVQKSERKCETGRELPRDGHPLRDALTRLVVQVCPVAARRAGHNSRLGGPRPSGQTGLQWANFPDFPTIFRLSWETSTFESDHSEGSRDSWE